MDEDDVLTKRTGALTAQIGAIVGSAVDRIREQIEANTDLERVGKLLPFRRAAQLHSAQTDDAGVEPTA